MPNTILPRTIFAVSYSERCRVARAGAPHGSELTPPAFVSAAAPLPPGLGSRPTSVSQALPGVPDASVTGAGGTAGLSSLLSFFPPGFWIVASSCFWNAAPRSRLSRGNEARTRRALSVVLGKLVRST